MVIHERLLAEVLKARARGAELRARTDLRALAKGRNAHRNEVIAHLFATGQLVGGRGKPITPPGAATTPTPSTDSEE